MANLRNQFDQALTNIEINGQKRKRAIDAHTEIRELLQGDEQLKEWGVEPILIGSYGRDSGIYPGKDVLRPPHHLGPLHVHRPRESANSSHPSVQQPQHPAPLRCWREISVLGITLPVRT